MSPAEKRVQTAAHLGAIESERALIQQYSTEIVERDVPGATWRLARMVSLLADMVADLAVYVATKDDEA